MTNKIKRSPLILLLACLLILGACAKEAPEAPADSTPVETPQAGAESESEAQEPIPQNEVVDYQAILGEWSEYLAYRAPEDDTLHAEALFLLPEGVGYTALGEHFAEVKTSHVEEEQTVFNYSLYNLRSGVRIVSDLESADGELDPRYTFRISGAVVELESAVWSVENGFVSSYRYYDAEGRLLNEEPAASSVWSSYEQDGCVFTTVGDRCYLSREGELIYTFKAGEERVLPAVDRSFGAYRYVFGEREITILDENYRELLSYPVSETYDESDLFVLSNGSLLLYRQSACEEHRADAVEDRFGNKAVLSYVLLDPAARTATESSPAFALAERGMITSAEDGGTCLAPRGDYQYAEVYKITNGVIATKATPVILDNQLNVVAELPLILKNQATLVGAINENQLMIRTAGVEESRGEDARIYSVNLVTCKTQLYPDLTSGVYRPVAGGFLFGDLLYNAAMTEKTTLSAGNYEILGGRIIERSEAGTVMISVTGGQFLRQTLAGDRVIYREDMGLFEVQASEGAERFLYNGRGELMASGTAATVVRRFADSLLIRCDGADGSAYYTVQVREGEIA